MPDLRGALLLSVCLGSATLGIVEGGTWGWGSPATIGLFAVAGASAVLTVLSSLHHRSPMLDPELLRIRGFLVSNIVTVAGGLGLYCYLLAHILWLHYVWQYSLLRAGLAVAPGAVVAALVSVPAGRVAERFGPRVVVVPGALIWSGAYVWYATRVGLHPDFVGQWLPGQVLSGIGVGCHPARRLCRWARYRARRPLRHGFGRQLQRPAVRRGPRHRHPDRLHLPRHPLHLCRRRPPRVGAGRGAVSPSPLWWPSSSAASGSRERRPTSLPAPLCSIASSNRR